MSETTTTIVKEVDASESEAVPSRTFTLPTGEPVTVVECPPEEPVLPSENIKELTIIESSEPAAEAAKEEIIEQAQEEQKDTAQAEEEQMEIVEAQEEQPTEEAVVIAEAAQESAEPAETIIVEESKPVEATKTTIMGQPAENVTIIDAAPAESVSVIEATAVQEEKVQEVLVKRPTVVERSVSMPILPTQPMQESRTVVEVLQAPVMAARQTQTVGKLEALRRRIAVFNSSVALTSICLQWSDKFHHELLDSSGHIVFSLHNRHKLYDSNGKEVACLHKSIWRSRWHAESMKHQNRLLTACRRHHGLVLQIRIQNCFTDRSEELVLLRNRLYDGSDPNTSRIAVLFDRDGMIQVAKGFDVGIAAIVAFMLKNWEVQGSRSCCYW